MQGRDEWLVPNRYIALIIEVFCRSVQHHQAPPQLVRPAELQEL